jgi:sodium/bile acid cotransporter 7
MERFHDVFLGITQFIERCKVIVIENFILLAFSIAILIALTFPFPGTTLGSYKLEEKGIVQFINTFIVFLISGITLKIEECHDLSKYYKSLIFGILSINFLTTLIGLIFLSCTFLSYEFRLGLTIFCCVPTTLGVGVALTQLSKGNVLLSLLLTVITNALGTITTPFLLMFYVSVGSASSSSDNNQNLHFDSISLLINLSLNVLLPTIIGILLRYFYSNTLIKFTKMYKTELSLFSTTNLAIIIWMALSKSRDLLLKQSISNIFIVLFCVILQHVFYLIGHYLLIWKLPFNVELSQTISLIIMCSQKSNPVALAVINGMGLNSKESGLLIIPGLLGQLSQIFIGSMLVQFFQKWVQQYTAISVKEVNDSIKDTENTENDFEKKEENNASDDNVEIIIKSEKNHEIEIEIEIEMLQVSYLDSKTEHQV